MESLKVVYILVLIFQRENKKIFIFQHGIKAKKRFLVGFFSSWSSVPSVAYHIHNLLLSSTFIHPFFLCFLLPMVEETSARILLNQLKTATHFDNLTLQITTEKLNGHNCLEWSQLAKLFLKSRGKMGYLCGTIEVPKLSDPSFESWDAENSIIMSWLLNSMQLEIGKPFLSLSLAKEVWDAVSQTYSKKGDSGWIYELKTMIHDKKQKDLSVTTYYNITLKVLWQELDLYQPIEMESAADATRLVEMIEWDQIFGFFGWIKSTIGSGKRSNTWKISSSIFT